MPQTVNVIKETQVSCNVHGGGLTYPCGTHGGRSTPINSAGTPITIDPSQFWQRKKLSIPNGRAIG